MLTAASIFVSPSLAYREIYSFRFCSLQVHRVGKVRIENNPNCHKRLNPVYPQVCTDSGKELKADVHTCVQKHSHFQKRERSGERGIFCDDGSGSSFLTCHLQDPGQFKLDCSRRQVLGTLTLTSLWYFLELHSYHSKV